ncbi:malectin domain-containing carbohydrate-binding protein, partial [Pseudotamlana agarivorans]|uniref:malectin domain-containing carbohydrate-binding protein n=1 Tax=Pseudotamlana agarivorans TaxID=481183 RepID=UPI000A7AD959
DDSGIVAYHWDFGDGNTATTADPVHTFVSEGIYTVTLTIEDAEGLQDSQELSIEVTPNLPAALIANEETLDFGSHTINGSASQLNLELFNNGDIGEDISISSISVTGTDAILFGHSEALPLTVNGQNTEILTVSFTPDGNIGTKSATIEITHSGENSPIIVSLSAILNDPNEFVPVVRINAGSLVTIPSTDFGPDWESNPSDGVYNGTSYSVSDGNTFESSLSYTNKDNSIPNYIDESTFNGLFNSERWDPSTGPEMNFSIPLPNGDYVINLFLGNSYEGTKNIGDRIFDVLLEGVVVEDNLDLVATYGHQVAGMLSYPVTVNDGVLNISFGHEVENPLVNAIEIMGPSSSSASKTINYDKGDEMSIASEIDEEQEKEISYFSSLVPNPADDFTQLIFDDASLNIDGILIYSSNGQLVKSITNPIKRDNKYNIQLGDLQEGLYFVNFMSSEGTIFSKKLMIRH